MTDKGTLTRIYLGRLTGTEIFSATSKEWIKMSQRESLNLAWQQHELFQDAVNYYTLALAGMLRADPSEFLTGEDLRDAESLVKWREQVKASWASFEKNGRRADGPQKRITKLLGLPENASFDDAADKVLAQTTSCAEIRFKAVAYLIKLCQTKNSSLNEVAASKLPFLCKAKNLFNSTPDNVKAIQDIRAQACLRSLEKDPNADIDPGFFLASYPASKNVLRGEAAKAELLKTFNMLLTKESELESIKGPLNESLAQHGSDLEIQTGGKGPQDRFRLARLYKVFPHEQLRSLLTKKNTTLLTKDIKEVIDDLAASRIDNNSSFEYFTNILTKRHSEAPVWDYFERSVFTEVLKYPHRYREDTANREAGITKIASHIQKYEGEGGDTVNEDDGDTYTIPGFAEDARVDKLKALLRVLSEDLKNSDDESVVASEFCIRRRTLKGWRDIKKEWGKEIRSDGIASPERLKELLNKYQSNNAHDIGSATLFIKLTEPEFQMIWSSKGTRAWHCQDVLNTWVQYYDLVLEKRKKERDIRYTPAHPVISPRFFPVPKDSKGCNHKSLGLVEFSVFKPGALGNVFELHQARFSYSSPRLKRDTGELPNGKDALTDWIQPLLEPFKAANNYQRQVNFKNTALTLYAKSPSQILFGFPVGIEGVTSGPSIVTGFTKDDLYRSKKGENFHIYWQEHEGENEKKRAKIPWYNSRSSFRLVSVDLGQRFAGAAARLLVHSDGKKLGGREIGRTDSLGAEKVWRAKVERTSILRLPGEDMRAVWRKPTNAERRAGEKGEAFRHELFGSKGRSSELWEIEEAIWLANLLKLSCGNLPSGWEERLSFPEQNDQIIRLVHRALGISRKLFRWSSLLAAPVDTGREVSIMDEIQGQTDLPILKELARTTESFSRNREKINNYIASYLPRYLNDIRHVMEILATRCYPIRGMVFKFELNLQSKTYILRLIKGPSIRKRRAVGQRGLNMTRIDQLTNLRRCFMSLNRLLVRTVGQDAELFKDQELPEPCPLLLRKLDHLRKQRVFQTAHLILREALGVELKPSIMEDRKSIKSLLSDRHGSYVCNPAKRPVDAIVIENLSRYKFDQGRSRWENSRLMQWCHRQIAMKLKQMCELVGITVIEVHAAYSSQFCANTGVGGFRADEVEYGFENCGYFERMGSLDKTRAGFIQEIKALQNEAIANKRRVKFLVPKRGGSIFIPLTDRICKDRKPAIQQADINAAINLGLRAAAQPGYFDIHHRLRTEAKKDVGQIKEKRFFKNKEIPTFRKDHNAKEEMAVNSNVNLFCDVGDIARWGRVEFISNTERMVDNTFVYAPALFQSVRGGEWERAMEINRARVKRPKSA